MTKSCLALIAALLFFGGAARSTGQTVNDIPFSEDYVLRTWEVTEGLRDNHISSIAQSSDGFLWITNLSGLFRFDGHRFVRMDGTSMPGLPSPWVVPVFAASDHSLWLALEREGVARWRQNKVETIVPIQPRPTTATWPWSFAEEPSGAIWVGSTSKGQASRILGGKVVSYSTADGVPAGNTTVLRVTSDGRVWCSTSGGCALFDGNRFQAVDPDAGGAARLMLAPSRTGSMWASRGGRLLRYSSSGGRLETIEPKWLREAGLINALHEDHTGTLWIGTQFFGVLRFRDGRFQRVHTPFADISCLSEDRDGNVWVGSWGGGLSRLSPRRFFLRKIQEGALSDLVGSLAEDPEGRLWILNRQGIPACASEPGGHAFAPVSGLPGGVQVLCGDPKSGVWLGTRRGLMQWHSGALHQTSLRDPIAALSLGREGNLWIGTFSGKVFSYRDEKAEAFGDVPEPRAVAEDSSGCLWVGTQQGSVFRRENGRFTPVSLPGAGPEETVRFIIPDGKDKVWLGTLLGGLYRWANGKVLRMPEIPGVSLAEIRSLLIERIESDDTQKSDNFWIGTATGLLRVSRGDLEPFLEKRHPTVHMILCGSNEGLPNAEFMEGARNSALQSTNGNLWFATNRGLLEIEPRAPPESPTSAQVVVEELSAGSLIFQPGTSDRLEFPPRPAAIRIRYTLPELGTPEQVRFRYRAGGSGRDGDWVEAGNQRETTIIQPEPGNYRFEVTAAVGNGPWSPSPAVVHFTVHPAWWQTAAIRWGGAITAIGAIAIGMREIVRRRMRARIRRLEQEHAVERERGRIARDMHDELGANLTHIAATTRLATLEPADAAAGHLREIAAVARQTVDSLDEIVWAVNPRNDTLASTVEYLGKYAARFLSASGIAVEIDLPPTPPARQIVAELRHHLFLAVKEALNNIVKHSGAGSARLSVRITADSLQVVIADDGRGFVLGMADEFSDGLANMRDRMAGIGGRCLIESRPGSGSNITFELPLTGEPVRAKST